MERLRQELYLLIEQYGIQDKRVVEKSQQLDKEIVKSTGGQIA